MINIVIIGRPNVGKSSIINRLLGKKTAITAREEGITRDIRYYDQEWNGKSFQICDSGGFVCPKKTNNPYQSKMNDMIRHELSRAHKIMFMVDCLHPDHPDDQSIWHEIKPYATKTLLVVNKVDNSERLTTLYSFYHYGISSIFPVSAFQNTGIGDVLDYLVQDVSVSTQTDDPPEYNIALIGKPNAGKSSLYNALFNQPRAIVDARMGTTRDVLESTLTCQDQSLHIMDTAGLRRRRNVTDTIEYFSIIRTERAIEDADIVIFLLDAQTLLTDQDKTIINHVISLHKNMVVFVNKWDTLERNTHTRTDIIRILEYHVPQLQHYPIIMGSAKEKHNIQSLLNTIVTVIEASNRRVQTAQLNDFLSTFFSIHQPPSKKGKRFKIYYATQVAKGPPHFIFKVNDHQLLTSPFLRNFEREFRDFFGDATGVGFRFEFRSKPKRTP